jgi:hypothetical protein
MQGDAGDGGLSRFHRGRRHGGQHGRGATRIRRSSRHAPARRVKFCAIDARDRIKLGAGGKIISAFDIARVIALGADWCNSARGFMFALGCIQSQSCHTDRCPTGVSTQDRSRQRALVVPDKAERVYNFHRATLESLADLVAAAGLEHPHQLALAHFSRRVSPREVRSFVELYPSLAPGELIVGTSDERFKSAWAMASAKHFRPSPAAA